MESAGALRCSPAASIIGETARRLATSHPHPLPCNGSCRAYPTQPWHSRPQLSCSSSTNGAMPWKSGASGNQPGGNPISNADKVRNKLESLFFDDSSLPIEEGGKPAISSSKALATGNKPQCALCEAKGAVQCATCTGSGLYVDSILESQGIIVKVRCLGCGGCGDILCPRCGGRGHV